LGYIFGSIKKTLLERIMDIIYQDKDILVCVKPAGVLSTDEPGGLPELVREALGDPNANVRTVHRLDRTVPRPPCFCEPAP